jgi:hypothetical protein
MQQIGMTFPVARDCKIGIGIKQRLDSCPVFGG